MNLGNCACGDDVVFQVETDLDPNITSSELEDEDVDVWTGVECATEDTEERNEQCALIEEADIGRVEDLFNSVKRPQISVRDLVGPPDEGQACNRADNETRRIYAMVDQGDGFDEGSDYQSNLPVVTDTDPPPEPDNITARGSEGRIVIEFDRPDSRTDDARYYQVLCAREDAPEDTSEFGGEDPQYWTSRQACGDAEADGVCPREQGSARVIAGPEADAGADAGTSDAGTGDAGPDGGSGDEPEGPCVESIPVGLRNLDPAHLCGTGEGTGESVEATGLENFVPYRVVLLVVDEARNVTAIDVGVHMPVPVQDFWEDYKDKGGRAEGGCSVGEAGAGAGVLVALAIAAFALRRRNRRGGGPGAAAGGALLLALSLAPRVADAQPWWEEYEEPVQEQVGPPMPRWGLELKLGPYVPDVDSEFGGDEQGPFELMFGDGPYLMSQITVDHYLLYPLGGQLGLSLTAGFLSRSANAYEVDVDGNVIVDEETGRPERAVGDTTTFRLWPTSLGVVYRYTQLDDALGIPIVPYGRAGLSYYYWWVSRPSGGVAIVDGDKGRGGSLGWQATGGLAIRAERLDPDAEISLRNELGIDHAGLVFEFTYAKVDGFGTDTKLSVGDATFFGGINFEF
jgi:MYXO-CTERM domain-containing protein